METVKISPKYQVVIPKGLREALELAPGQKVHMIAYSDRIEMIPVKRISDMRGVPQRGSIRRSSGKRTAYEPRRFVRLVGVFR